VLDGGRGVGILGVCSGHYLWYTVRFHSLVVESSGPMQALWLGLQSTWIGIDFFFVVSGLLITRILLDSKNDPAGLYFRNFYGRRVLRIFPLYYGILAVIFLVLPHYVPFNTPSLHRLQSHQIYLWLYLQNLFNVGGWHSGLLNLGHCWSLAVEEHFYLTWPLLVYFFSRKGLIRITTGMILICPCIRWYLVTIDWGNVVYVNTLCRMDAIAYGCLLTLILEDAALKARFLAVARPLLLFGLAGMATCFVVGGPAWFRFHQLDTFGLAALDLASCAYTFLVLAGQLPLHTRLLQTRWLCFVGKNTYGIYLLHYLILPTLDRLVPVAWFLQTVSNWFLAVVAHQIVELAVTVAVAATIRELYEKQFLRLNRFFPRKPIVLAVSDAPAESVISPIGSTA
ncbi:MAG TPA: acyltransferase, partial [Candidatus Xenobia bacterium]